MVARHEELYAQVVAHCRETALLTSIDALLGWDERCMLPSAGGDHRAEQMTLLAGLIHERQTALKLGDWLNELASGPLAADKESDAAANIRQLKYHYEKRTKLPKKLVEELARAAVRGQQIWQEARAKNDYQLFKPALAQMYALKREQAKAIGYTEHIYDALLDDYEQGERTRELTSVLAKLREQLVPLVSAIGASRHKPATTVLERTFPVAAQQQFGQEAARRIGFDFERGRLDVTAHPFCTTLGPGDIRLTTRYDEKFFNAGFFGILHEAGHGLYEQGLPRDQFGLPMAEAVSLGIHESQSRLWENLVGRSRPFWQHMFPAAQQAFPDALGNVSLDAFYAAVNDVQPSLIRVEADEATYNLHILIRFELEQALLTDDLRVDDLPQAWNEKYHNFLGIVPPNDADGVLQDIHWSAGLIGYFPTYTLGNLYSAQLYDQADKDLGGLGVMLARGEFAPLLEWLRTNIHRHGQRWSATELARRATKKPLDHAPLMTYLRSKYEPLYRL
ncbi:MAG: carboxypeptidase M32 [Planctomycetes bacterium]|nr:carboxypeptidase M32 [Planctomycetota bacterium]